MKKLVFYVQILAMVFFAMSGFFAALPAAQAVGPVTLSVVTPVPTYTSSTSPSFTFNSDMAVTSSGVYVGGSCGTWSGYVGGAGIASGDNTIVFDTPGLGEGTYSDCYIEANNGAGTTTLNVPEFTVDLTDPYLNATLGDGSSDYELPSTCPSVACDRGDTYGAALVFSEELDSAGKTAVEEAITAGADVAPRVYMWSGNRVRIYATTSVTFPEDVYANITDLAGNTTNNVKLIDSFSTYIQDLIDAADPGDTIVIPAGIYEENIEINKSLTLIGDIGDDLVGPGENAPTIINVVYGYNRTININANNVTVRGFIVENTESYPAIRIANNVTGALVKNNELRNAYTGVGLATGAHGNTVTKNSSHDNSYGINIGGAYGNIISYNEIYDNSDDGINLQTGGCNMDGCVSTIGGNNINNNEIHDNHDNGIYFDSDLDTSDGTVLIDSNIISSSSYAGIYINSGTNGVSIENNTISNNGQSEESTGIHVVSATGNSAHNNIISNDNYDVAINNEDPNLFDASYNYWGDANGPYEATLNPDGNIHSGIVGNVRFQPYYLDEAMTTTSTVPSAVYVDDDYYDGGGNDGHDWGINAFDNIQDGIDAVLDGGIVYVMPGNYDEEVKINRPLTLEGDVGDETAGPGENAPVISDTYCNDPTVDINANNVTVEGFIINSDCSYPNIRVKYASGANIFDNELTNNYVGIGLTPFSSGATVMRNLIHDVTYYGYGIGIVVGGSPDNTISNNTIYNNSYGIEIKCGNGGSNCDSSGTDISNNDITGSTYGVYFHAGNQGSTVTLGPGNDIYGNDDGIYVYGDAGNFVIHGNKIHENVLPTSGLHVVNTTFLDATRNWWGDPAGPLVNEEPTEETINRELIDMSADGGGDLATMILFFRPFCTDEACNTLSSVEVAADNLETLFQNGGSITPILDNPGDDDLDPSTVIVNTLQVNETTTISIPSGAGTSTVVLPVGTVITKTDGGTFDANDLTAADVALSGLSGFAAGVVVEGAFQWGIPSLGLTFNPAITLNIYVGTDLNGQTLTIYRSNSQTSGWETSGIVAPGTCVVSAGVCTFKTTKASYFAATKSTATGGTSGGILLSYQTNLNNQTTTPATTYAYPVTPTHNFIKVKGQSAVYWLSSENKRYLFANREVFSSWFGDDFSGLREISQEDFDAIPFGGNLTVKPGSYLRFDNQATIYYVSGNTDIYPATVTPSRVFNIQASFENNYRLRGQIRKGINLLETILNNQFVKITGQPAVYWLSPENVRYLFTNRDVFGSWFANFLGLREISQAEFDQLSSGGNLTVKPGSYLKFDNSDILYKVVNSNNICKTANAAANFYKVQAGFEADYNLIGDCQ